MTDKTYMEGTVSVTQNRIIMLSFPIEYEGRYKVKPYHNGLMLSPSDAGVKSLSQGTAGATYFKVAQKYSRQADIDTTVPLQSIPAEMWRKDKNGAIYVPGIKTVLNEYAARHGDNDKPTEPAVYTPKEQAALPKGLDRDFIKEMIDGLNDYRQHGLVMRVEDSELKAQIRIVEDI